MESRRQKPSGNYYHEPHQGNAVLQTVCVVSGLGRTDICRLKPPHKRGLCPGVPVHRRNNDCTPFFRNLCLTVEYCWVFCIGSCEPVHEDRTQEGEDGDTTNQEESTTDSREEY